MATKKNINEVATEVKETHFCMTCGTKFEATSPLVRYCPECQAKKKAEQKEKQKGYAKARTERLGLTNIQVYKTDKEKLAKLAKEQNTTMAEVLKNLLAGK